MMEGPSIFLHGALCGLSVVAALFFLHDRRTTGDRLFDFFAFAFGALAANWLALAVVGSSNEHDVLIFSLRASAFVAIAVGIIDKNRRDL